MVGSREHATQGRWTVRREELGPGMMQGDSPSSTAPGEGSEREPNAGARETTGTAAGLVPYWLYTTEGGARIERHSPTLPLSRDRLHLDALRPSLAVYRMVFGQPRQDDLLAYLVERLGEEELAEAKELLQIDLRPGS